MKKTLLTALAALPLLAIGQTTIQSENFDSYTVGGTVADQSADWVTWSNIVSEDAIIADTLSVSASNSMYLYNTGPQAYLHDVVYPFTSVYTTGRYEFKMKVYVTSGNGAYFGLGSVWATGAAGYEWGPSIYFNADGSIHEQNNGASSQTYTQDSWVDVSVIVDLDALTFEYFINSVSGGTGGWTPVNGFGNVNIWAAGYADATGTTEVTANYYIDDVELIELPSNANADEIVAVPALNVVPNPSNGNFTINYANISMDNANVVVKNALGQSVHTTKLNNAENGSKAMNLNLRSGVYFVTISDGNAKITKKLIVR